MMNHPKDQVASKYSREWLERTRDLLMQGIDCDISALRKKKKNHAAFEKNSGDALMASDEGITSNDSIVSRPSQGMVITKDFFSNRTLEGTLQPSVECSCPYCDESLMFLTTSAGTKSGNPFSMLSQCADSAPDSLPSITISPSSLPASSHRNEPDHLAVSEAMIQSEDSNCAQKPEDHTSVVTQLSNAPDRRWEPSFDVAEGLQSKARRLQGIAPLSATTSISSDSTTDTLRDWTTGTEWMWESAILEFTMQSSASDE